MKKLAFLFCFLFVGYAQAANHYGCTGLIGGATGALDALDITGASTPNADNLADGDSALVTTISGTTVLAYWYIFDADGTTAESSPTVIRPDDYATAGVWRLAVFNANAVPDISATYQTADADLTTYAGITPSANVQSLLGAADYSAMRTQLSLVPGTNVLAMSGGTLTDTLVTDASDATASGLRLPHGAAPSAPTNGDLWTTTAGLYARINGATVGPFGTGGATALDDVANPDGVWNPNSGTYDHLIDFGLGGEWRFRTAAAHYISLGDVPTTGTHNGSENAATLSDSTASFTVDALIGLTVYNTTDGSSGIVTDNDATTVTATLSGGTDNDWDSSDAYSIPYITLNLNGYARIYGISVLTASTSVGTAAAEVPNYYGADSHVFSLGNDQDVLITHVADTGINLTTTAATSGVFNLGNDDDVNDDSIDLILHDSGVITLYDANDDTSVTLSVGDGTTTLSVGGGITSTGTVEGATLTEGGQAVYNASETPGGELGGTWASPTVDDTGITLTSITIGALLGVDSIDATGAVDMDIGSADITDVTIITDGGADSLTIGNNADLDFGITFDSDTDDLTLNWDEDNSEFELNAPNYRFGANADEDIVFVLDSDTNDLTMTWDEDNNTLTLSTSTLTLAAANNPYIILDDDDDADFYIINDDAGQEIEFSTDSTVSQNNLATLSETGTFTTTAGVTVGTLLSTSPQSLSVTTEADITLTGSMLLLTGDDDSDSDTIDLQNGTTAGQHLIIIGVAGIDNVDDTITVAMTDTTCTGCTTVLFDEIGDSYGCDWTGSTWNCYQLNEVP